MSIFDHSSTMPGSNGEQEDEIETQEGSEKEPTEEVVPEAGEEKAEGLSGESVKVPAILKPKHMEWLKEQDFGLSEWVRDSIDEEIEREKNAETEGNDKSSEDPNIPSGTCDVCGENPVSTEITEDGETTKLCEGCLQDKHGGSPQEREAEKQKEQKKENGDSDSNQPCAICGEVKDSVEEIPMGPGRNKKPLCEICAREEGFRQARRQ